MKITINLKEKQWYKASDGKKELLRQMVEIAIENEPRFMDLLFLDGEDVLCIDIESVDIE